MAGKQGVAQKLEKPIRISVPEYQKLNIVLVGCGGTGGFLAQNVARMAYHLSQKRKGVKLVFVDPDRVERGNLGRQNFCPADDGGYKAEILAKRYGLAYGLNIEFINRPFNTDWKNIIDPEAMNVFLGAVDNRSARLKIRDVMAKAKANIWWIDAGNSFLTGQVLCGNVAGENSFVVKMGVMPAIPGPSLQMPGLIDVQKDTVAVQAGDGLSCMERAMNEGQSLMVNMAAAVFAAQFLYELCVDRQVTKLSTHFDLSANTAQSRFITKSALLGSETAKP